MKILIFLTAFVATSALADFEVKVDRIEASVIDNAEESANEVKADVDVMTATGIENKAVVGDPGSPEQGDVTGTVRGKPYNSSRPNRSQGDEAGVLKGISNARRLDDDSDGDGLVDTVRACGVDDDCDGDLDEATLDAARQARRQDRKTTRN